MIRAVCFNRKGFAPEVMKRICSETGAENLGCLTDPAMTNCLESFPNGTLQLSFSWKADRNVFNCHEDIEMFIYVNKWGNNGDKRKDAARKGDGRG